MNVRASAADYDGTIARHGTVEPSTARALEQFKASGRKILLVTGREIPDLLSIFSELSLFDLIVAENGALLYDPRTKQSRALAPLPSPVFIDHLRQAGVHPLSIGRAIVATQETYYGVVSRIIAELGLDLRIIMNKGAMMVLPSHINKATGLREALSTFAENKLAVSALPAFARVAMSILVAMTALITVSSLVAMSAVSIVASSAMIVAFIVPFAATGRFAA